MKLVKACAIMLGFMSSNPATFLANAADDTMIQQGEREVQVTASVSIESRQTSLIHVCHIFYICILYLVQWLLSIREESP